MHLSPSKLAANAANAQLSTGPRSDAGKARASCNSLKHGLCAKTVVVTDDQRQEFEDMQERMLSEVDPDGSLELEIFYHLVHAAWNVRRCRALEAGLMSGDVDPLLDDGSGKKLDRIYRYLNQNQRAWYKAMNELRALQTNRKLKESLIQDEEAMPVLASAAPILKQTRAFARHQAAMSDYELEQYVHGAMLRACSRGAVQNEPTAPVPAPGEPAAVQNEPTVPGAEDR